MKALARVVEQGPSEWVLTLETLQGQERGERVLKGSSCLGVTQAAALVLALTIDPDATVKQPEPREEPRPLDAEGQGSAQQSRAPANGSKPARDTTRPRRGDAKPSTPPPDASPALTKGSGKDPLTFALQGRGLGGVGLLPGVAWGVGGAATVRWRRLGLRAFGHYWFKQRGWAKEAQNKGGVFELLGGGVAVCVAVIRSLVLLEPFLGAEFDQLRAEGRGVDVSQQVKARSVALLVGSSVALPVSEHAFVSTEIHAALPSRRREFVLDDIGRVYLPERVSGRLALGVGWRL